ncbi:hybrid sensor histidine kinase/response regulator [Paenibacillus hamazuiensis]|uniref:hybrid sensor histidine kinase/response regulator n=1 Tax=Paenibacillus hamazuiensis TaxID=2936508 RepID=UPI00200DBF0F|nr:hybrid sensor histidine kinase/response regulator [Paenibacillus hamazuiensis]
MQNQEFLKDFIEEAVSHLDSLEMGLVQMGEGSEDPEILNTIFRAVHSIKGTAGFFALKNIVALAHAMENIFGELKKSVFVADQSLIDRLLAATDILRAMIMDVETSDGLDISDVLAQLSEQQGEREIAVPPQAARDDESAGLEGPPAPSEEEAKKQPENPKDTIRVPVSLLNDLLNLVGEMVLGRNQLLRTLRSYRKAVPGLSAVLQNIDGTTSELQDKIMQARMQPVSKVFDKFPRMIRELSKELGKDIDLQMEGTGVELDKSLIEALADPLNHLIRNAADHGIERPDERERAGKPKTGTISLKASHVGDHVTIDVADDGAGIRVDKIADKAVQQGLLSRMEAAELSESELLNYVFHPGLSSAEKVTNISGRGIGMDVVKTNIEKIGGAVEIRTAQGKGTVFHLTLPLTLAIIPSLIVETGGYKFALPQVNLQEMLRIKPNNPDKRFERLKNSWVLRLRGKLIPVVQLADVLGIREDSFDPEDKVSHVLVLKSGTKRYGLAVDVIHDREEILVKSLPRFFNRSACYSGVTIMGDGKTALILDPEGIAGKANLRFYEETEQTAVQKAESMDERQNLLLFGCSGPETLGIDLSFVVRVEKIDASQIEKVGDKEFIQFRGDALRIIRPEQYLPLRRVQTDVQNLYVIIPKLVKHPIGLLIEKIHDTLVTDVRYTGEEVKAKGLIGQTIIGGTLVQLVHIYELLEMAAPEYYPPLPYANKSKGTVLLVEDTPYFARMVGNFLESDYYETLLAANVKEAWSILQERPIDAVLCDAQMLHPHGAQLAKRIRADARLQAMPVIALASAAGSRMTQETMEAGFDDVALKLDKDRLLETIRELLRGRRELHEGKGADLLSM